MSAKPKAEQAVEEYEEGELLRLEDLCLIKSDRMAVADHANGILVFQLGPSNGGRLLKHLNGDKDTLAFSVRYNENSDELYALILDVPGWMLNVYKADPDFQLVRRIEAPSQPEVARLKLRWLTVTKHGDVFVLAAGNVWTMKNGEWALVHSDQRKQAWYSHLTPIGNNTEMGEFVVCWKGRKLRRVKLEEENGLRVEEDLGTGDVKEMGAFAVDEEGNVVISDWRTGEIVMRDKYDKTKRRLLGVVGEAEAYVMAAAQRKVYVGCKSSLQVRVFNY